VTDQDREEPRPGRGRGGIVTVVVTRRRRHPRAHDPAAVTTGGAARLPHHPAEAEQGARLNTLEPMIRPRDF